MGAHADSSVRAARGRGIAGLAAGGVVIGHLLGYLVAFPSGLERHAHLAAAGHESFHLLGIPAVTAAGLSLFLLGIRTLRGERGRPVPATALALASLQVPSFLLLELSERHFDAALTFADRGVVSGVLMQLLVAMLLALLLCGFVRAVEVVATRLRRSRRRAAVGGRSHAPVMLLRPGADLLICARRRAPPALASI